MESKTGRRQNDLLNFLKNNWRRILIVLVAALIGQVANVGISGYSADFLYPLSFLPLIFIAGGGGLVGLVGYSLGATVGDLIKFGLSLSLVLFDLFAFGIAGWLTGLALKSRSGIGQVILSLISTIIAGMIVVVISPIGINLGKSVPYSLLYARYLYGWLPLFIVPTLLLSYWMGRIRDQVSKLVESLGGKKSSTTPDSKGKQP